MTDDEVRLFTVEEANGVLDEIVPLLTALQEAHRSMEEIHEVVMGSLPTNGGGAAHQRYLECSNDAARSLNALTEMGVLVRDPATGLIDFPSERDGREVFLCFQLGEGSVEWWHPPETGRAGRRPL